MAVIFNPATVRLTGGLQTAAPNVDILSETVVCHMTQNYTAGSGNPHGVAFTVNGQVDVTGPLAGWDFGFIQFAQANFLGVFYAGRISSEGAIGIVAHTPPALAKPILLDSDNAFTPWTKNAPHFTSAGSTVHASTGDHPALKVALERRNSLKNVHNFLFHVLDKRDMVTIFTAQDPQGNFHFLAHFEWSMVYDFKFNWIGGKPVKGQTQSTIRPQGAVQMVRGAPTAGQWKTLLDSPVGPQFNDETRTALFKARNGARGANLNELPTWFNNVPRDFFQ
jgi:hypothetical protein